MKLLTVLARLSATALPLAGLKIWLVDAARFDTGAAFDAACSGTNHFAEEAHHRTLIGSCLIFNRTEHGIDAVDIAATKLSHQGILLVLQRTL